MRKKYGVWYFLIGLGAFTQVHFGGCIGISELVLFIIAPFVFFKDLRLLRADGFVIYLSLVIISLIMCPLGTCLNGMPILASIKVEAQIYSMFAVTVVMHRLLRSDMRGFKWLFVGFFLSSVISIFIFHPIEHADELGRFTADQSADRIMSGMMFWMGRLRLLMDVFTAGFYFQTPILLSGLMPIAYTIFLALTTITGRSASAVVMLGALLVLLGRKSRSVMNRLSRMVWLLVVLLVACGAGLKFAYTKAVKSGALGDEALGKYESQTRTGEGFLNLLMSGRKEFFIGCWGALHKPFIGYGAYPIDRDGYTEEFLAHYGTQGELNLFQERRLLSGGIVLLPSHSYLAGAWLRYGIVGLFLWLYVIFLLVRHIRKNMGVIPQWFGYFAFAMPTLAWNILFSPYNERMTAPLVVCCLLIVQAVRKGTIRMPFEMIKEADRHD